MIQTAYGMLMLNLGSSSIKFKIFSDNNDLTVLAHGQVSGLGDRPEFSATITDQKNQQQQSLAKDSTPHSALTFILDWLSANGGKWKLKAVTHRVVHGGDIFIKSIKLDAKNIEQLKTLIPLAPSHQPYNIAAFETVKKIKPEIPQFACFDTSFHANQNPLFSSYALPETLRKRGIRKYGFHGLSYEWLSYFLKTNEPSLVKQRIIAAHLGSGSSLCAMQNGISIDTTMGMTALAGLPMSTRCGDIDPGVVTYLIRELGLSPAEVESILYEKSGLLGLSSLTQNVKLLEESQDKRAQFALAFFCLKVAQYIGMMAVGISGIDALVFTGGVGENSDFVRNKVLHHLQFLRPFEVRVIPTDEEKIMAMHTRELLNETAYE